MKLLGLQMPKPTHQGALWAVLGSLAVVIGFAIGSSMLGTPIDRPGAIALFLGCLYTFAINPLMSAGDARGRRILIAAGGAGILIAIASVLEHSAIL